MSNETAGAETPAAEGVTPEAPVVTPESTTGQPEGADQPDPQSGADDTPDTGDDAAAKPKRKHWAHERIDELTRQRREAERQAEHWKARATQTVDPSSLDFEEGIAERTIQRTRQEQADTARASVDMLAAEAFGYREAEARDRFADYDTVTRNPGIAITPSMAEIIRDSDVGPDLAYHLGKNPVEAAKIAALPPTRQAVELGKLEARVTAPKPLPKQPPAPVQPVSGIAAGGTKDPGKMTMAEFKAWREAKT